MEGETKLCTNCKRDISTSNFVMHEMHCRRHIVLCDICDEPIPRSEADQHFNDVHQKVPCELCKNKIAKDRMEHHMENQCLKKQMRCEYCELSFPKDGYEAHINYCGSRTECCNLCQQYVMLKDMTQHEVSGCTYPEPKPATSSNQTSSGAAPSDPFSMSYLQEFLTSDLSRAPNHVPSNIQRQHARHGRDRPPRSGAIKTRPSQQTARGRQSTKNKSNINSDRERGRGRGTEATGNSFLGSSVDLPPDMDYDTMLALQLAHEDLVNQGEGNLNIAREMENNDDGLNYHWQHFSENDFGTEFQMQPDQPVATEDGMTIPCEACHLEIPVDMYIEHTDYCWQGSEPNNATTIPAITTESRERNNALPVASDNLRSSIPVIDNLHQSDNPFRIQASNSQLDFDGDADYGLPCEFCEEEFPSEVILQHQVVCPMNTSATPRATTPAGALRSSRRQDKDKDNNQVRAAFSSALSAGLSGFGGDSGLVHGHDNEEDDGPRSNFFRDESYKNSLQSVSDKYGGSPTSDRSSYFATHRSSRRGSNNRDVQDNEDPTRTYEPARPNRSAQRARASLNRLLQDTDSNDSQRGSNQSHNVSSRHRRGVTASNNSTGAVSNNRARKSVGVDSKTVYREVNREAERASQNGLASRSTRPRANNVSSVNAATNTTTASSTTSRNRQRSDHVFSPELRPKPSDNRRR